MDYKNKYLKYKIKYLQLKNYNQIGGKSSLVIHISGPSGSGKSTLGNKLKEIYDNKIIVKDIDDLRREFIDLFYDDTWTGDTFDNEKYQEFIDKFVNANDKPIIFVGLNHMPWWHEDLYYNMHPNHKFYIKLDDNIVIKQKCSRFINDIHENQKEILNDLIDNEIETITKLEKGLKENCGEHDETKRLNNIWNTYYPSDGYGELTREEILDRVKDILNDHLGIMTGGDKKTKTTHRRYRKIKMDDYGRKTIKE
jgi:adenylate kinase family enzyme